LTGAPVISLRPVGPDDLRLICDQRHRVFEEAGRDAATLAAMAGPFEAWLAPLLADGRYFGFIAQSGSTPVGGIGLMELSWPPHPAHPVDARRGYVLNVHVEADFRRRGIARQMMDAAEQEFRRRGIGYMILHATAQGVPLYAGLGWRQTSEMGKALQ
jgi:ribosomal protein S18 acetylase RimI-like enzyme